MKRFVAAAIGICLVGSVMAQGSFTIVRPADGSKVREKVRVLIPKNSIDAGSYIGVFLDGKFVEAVQPGIDATNKNYRVYTLDTKGRNIPDGELKLELVKYEGTDSPRISDRSSVTVTVGNHMNIQIPAGGVKLRYGFTPGQQMVYNYREVKTITTLSGIGNDNGSHPSTIDAGEITHRLAYIADNIYGNGDALMRIQLLPDKGKDYATFAAEGEAEARQHFDYEMVPIYMRVSKTGRSVFGSVPAYFGFSSGGSMEGGTIVFGAWPLPVLPERAVRPGSNWNGAYEVPKVSSGDAAFLASSVSSSYPARGEFISAEWEMGHPCAKIRNSIAAGTRSMAGMAAAKQGKSFDDNKVALDETIYFALDTHKIIKMVRATTIDSKVQMEGSGTTPNNPPPGAGPALKGPENQGNSVGAGGGIIRDGGVPTSNRQKFGLGGGRQNPPATGSGPAQNQGRGNRGGGAAGGGARTRYVRQRTEQIFILEQ